MKALIILISSCLSLTAFGQKRISKPLKCTGINEILSDKELIHHFLLEHKGNDTIVIVDTFGVFLNCGSYVENGTVFIISDVIPNEVKKGPEYSYINFQKRKTINIIVIEEAALANDTYTLRLWQAKDNATALISLYRTNNETKITIKETGIY